MDERNMGLEIMRLIREVGMLLRHTMSKGVEGMGMTAPQGMLVGTLARFGRMKVSDLSEKVGLSNSTVSGIIDRLENQGMIERTRSEEDRRVVYVNLTPKFQEVHKDFHKKAEENIQKLLSRADTEDIKKLIEGLDAFKRILNASRDNEE